VRPRARRRRDDLFGFSIDFGSRPIDLTDLAFDRGHPRHPPTSKTSWMLHGGTVAAAEPGSGGARATASSLVGGAATARVKTFQEVCSSAG